MRVGIVGLGFMGRMHYRCWSTLPGATVTAVCEANPAVLAAAGEPAKGNVPGAAEFIDLSTLSVFQDFEELLASGTVDAVSITLPTFLHADMSVRALEAGLHVLCEKPMALTVEDCDRMIAASRQSGRVLQIGHCIRFWPEYVVTRDLVRSGTYGAMLGASFRRYTAMPAWSPDSWFADESRSGGQPLDLHIHDTDYIQSLLGMPTAVISQADEAQTLMMTLFEYPAGTPVVAEGTWRMAPTFGFEMSFNVMLERATIQYDLTRPTPFRVCPAEGEAFTPELPPGDGYSREVEHFARAVAGEHVEPIATPESSRETIRLALAEKRSARERTRILLGS